MVRSIRSIRSMSILRSVRSFRLGRATQRYSPSLSLANEPVVVGSGGMCHPQSQRRMTGVLPLPGPLLPSPFLRPRLGHQVEGVGALVLRGESQSLASVWL